MWDTRPRYFCLKSLYFQRKMEKQLFFSVLTQMLYRKEKPHSSESTELLLGEGRERVRKRLSGKFLKMGSPQVLQNSPVTSVEKWTIGLHSSDKAGRRLQFSCRN